MNNSMFNIGGILAYGMTAKTGIFQFKMLFFQLRGMYMTRQLSFAGVSFDIKELPLSRDFIEMYDASVKLVSKQEYRKYPHRSTLGRVTSNSEG